jgi:hypothetical protein
MSANKIETALNLIEIIESNLKTAKALLNQVAIEKGVKITAEARTPGMRSTEEATSLEVVEGYFDGESMIGDNGKLYLVPQNYASKTQLVVGDRMKWILTPDREVFKLIQPASRERVIGTFNIEGDNFVVLVDRYPNPIKILKASATYAMKHLGLQPGNEVAIYVPKDTTPTWGAFINVMTGNQTESHTQETNTSAPAELDSLNEFKIDDQAKMDAEKDYF